MTISQLTIASRESPLAMRQTEMVKQALLYKHAALKHISILGMTTQADRMLEASLLSLGGKGVFVKELEEALYDRRANIAVHSMKDVPMDLPPGLIIPAITKREDPRDAFVANEFNSIADLPSGAKVGTSSARRQTQLQKIRPDIEFCMLRGNINTRLKRLDAGDFSAIILASAGLWRMGLQHRIKNYLEPEVCLPAAAQGALGIECRADDEQTIAWIRALNHEPTAICVTAERAVCRSLNGGCKVPIAAFAEIQQDSLILSALVADCDSTRILRASGQAALHEAVQLGERIAEQLRSQGAEEILQKYR